MTSDTVLSQETIAMSDDPLHEFTLTMFRDGSAILGYSQPGASTMIHLAHADVYALSALLSERAAP